MKLASKQTKPLALFFLAFIGAVSAVLLPGLPKLETKNNYENDLPQDDSIISQNRKMEEVFGKRDELIVVVCAEDVLAPATLKKVSRITREIKEIPGVVSYEVLSLTETDHIANQDDLLKAGKLIRRIPVGSEEVERLRATIDSDRLLAGRLVSRDYTRTIILARLGKGYKQSLVTTEAESLVSRYSGPERIYLLGDPVIGEEVDRAIEGDVKKLFPIAFGLMLLLFFLFFRSVSGVLLPALVILLSVLWTLGFAGHMGYPLTVVTSAIPVLLVAVASSYGIHMMHGYRYFSRLDAAGAGNALTRAVRTVRLPIIITGLTSALSSITLLAFRITSIREFGVLSAVGILFAMFLSLTMVPAFLVLLDKPAAGAAKNADTGGQPSEGLAGPFTRIPFYHRGKIFLVCAVVLLVSLAGALRLKVGMDPLGYFPEDFPFSRNVDDYDSHFGGARKMYVLVEGNNTTVKNPELLGQISRFQKKIESEPSVGASFSFADVIKRIALVVDEESAGSEKLPDTENEIAQLTLLYSTAGSPETFESVVSPDYRQTKVTVDVRTSDVETHKRLYETLREAAGKIFGQGAQVSFGGLMMVWIAMIRYIVIGKMLNVLLTLVVLVGIGSVAFKSFRLGALAVLPVTLAMLVNFGVMGYTGIKLNMATAIITAMGAGVGVDFAVHYLCRVKEQLQKGADLEAAVHATMQLSGKAILLDMGSNLCGFSVFIFSPFEPVSQFGWLICLTMVSSTAGALLLIPACLGFIYKDRDYA